jgi:hypothetical protein
MAVKNIFKDLNTTKNLFYDNTGLTKKNIINPDVFNKPIFKKEPKKNKNGDYECKSTPVAHTLTIDTEYQDIGSCLNSEAKFNNGRDRYDQKFIHQNTYINYYNYIKQNYNNDMNIDIDDVIRNPHKYTDILKNIPENYLSDNYYTLTSPQLISIQIKNSLELESKGEIYISEYANQFREGYINDNPHLAYKFKNYNYDVISNEKSIIEQFMQKQGYDYKINIVDEQTYYEAILPYLTINIVVYHGIVDIPFLFPTNNDERKNYYNEINKHIRNGTLNFDKRLKSNFFDKEKNYSKHVEPLWFVGVNGNLFKPKLNIIDAVAMQGVISLKQFFKNNNINTKNKGLLDKYKTRMIEALVEEPEYFNDYSLSDLQIYNAILNYNNSNKEINRKVGVEEKRIEDISYTLGSTCNKTLLSKEQQLFNVNTKKEKDLFIEQNCKSASSNYLGIYDRFSDDIKDRLDHTNSIYIRKILAKLDGGRCHSTNPLLTGIYYKDPKKQNFLFDMDIEGAYTTTMSTMYKYYGEAVCYLFRVKEYLSLREIIKLFKKEMGTDNYMFKVSGLLKYLQDFIPSYINSDKSYKCEIVKIDEINSQVNVKYDSKKTKNIILSKEIIDGTITSSILDVILNAFHPLQRDDFLDNLKVSCILIYPLSMEVKTVEELQEKRQLHDSGKKDYSYKYLSQYIDKERGNKCHYYIKKDFGELFIDKIRANRNYYKYEGLVDSPNKEEAFKLVGNTTYGVSVSELFPNSDIIFGNNITGNVRSYMWLAEKCLNIPQSITDGGVVDFFKVKHRIYEYFDTREFANSYKYSKKELSQDKKWYNRPLNYRQAIYNKKSNKWLLDGVEYDEKPFINNEAYYNEDTNTWFISGVEYDKNTIKEKISELCVEHVRKCFPKVKFINEEYRCFKKDEKGRVLFDENNNIIYTKRIGMFTLELKNIMEKYYCSGMSNYMYYNYENNLTVKTRCHETKKDEDGYLRKEHTAILKGEDNYIKLCSETYLKTATTERFYLEREKNLEAMPLIPPVFVSTILKTSDYKHKFNSTYQYNTEIRVGSVVYKLVIKRYFEISQFHFISAKQYLMVVRLNARLIREFGLGIEIFYFNPDGTINLKKMYKEISEMISNGVTDFLKILDPHNHINRKIPPIVQEYIKRLNLAKLQLRLINVGIVQFVRENGKVTEDVIDYCDLDFNDLHKKSHDSEYLSEDEIWK